ncbi:MAG: hypothetical protein SFX19_09950 [Alphaproteobacteria bacterium]|nr:hypothetical protein [Alphaproteobacteria bacterium]
MLGLLDFFCDGWQCRAGFDKAQQVFQFIFELPQSIFQLLTLGSACLLDFTDQKIAVL